MGTEIYWHGILDYSSRENRRIREVHDVYEKLQGMQELAGARYEAKVGVLKDYDNIWDAQLDVWHQRVDEASQKALFEAARDRASGGASEAVCGSRWNACHRLPQRL